MRTLYIECNMGAAGDMLTAALYELLNDTQKQEFLRTMNTLGLPGVSVTAESSEKCGIRGTHMRVVVNGEEELPGGMHEHVHDHDHHHEHEHEHDHDHDHDHEHEHEHHHEHEHEHEHEHHHDHEHGHTHSHSSLHDIEHLVRDHMTVPNAIKDDVMAVYTLIAQAESHAHGMPVSDIHFHEVGTADAIADITGVCLALHLLAPEQILCSPINVGSGHVHCAHGILPVPAPATAHILQGVPIYSGHIESELCTPTGAALLKHFAAKFCAMPTMVLSGCGYGMGKKDFSQANCVRALLGDTDEGADDVAELQCNIDDMTAEEIGYACEKLMERGALEVFTTPVNMKKFRPGTLLTVLCRPEEQEHFETLMLQLTETIGVRSCLKKRRVLSREPYTCTRGNYTAAGKRSYGADIERSKLEYDDLAAIADAEGISLREARKHFD